MRRESLVEGLLVHPSCLTHSPGLPEGEGAREILVQGRSGDVLRPAQCFFGLRPRRHARLVNCGCAAVVYRAVRIAQQHLLEHLETFLRAVCSVTVENFYSYLPVGVLT